MGVHSLTLKCFPAGDSSFSQTTALSRELDIKKSIQSRMAMWRKIQKDGDMSTHTHTHKHQTQDQQCHSSRKR